MIVLQVETLIAAPPEVCFDLARDMSAHAETMAHTGERIVACPDRLLELGDEVTFEARHLGITQRLTSRIVAFECPSIFTDKMVSGAFKSLEHDHRFEHAPEGTRMIEVVRMSAPFGPLGWVVERVVLSAYMRRLLTKRGQQLKHYGRGPAASNLTGGRPVHG